MQGKHRPSENLLERGIGKFWCKPNFSYDLMIRPRLPKDKKGAFQHQVFLVTCMLHVDIVHSIFHLANPMRRGHPRPFIFLLELYIFVSFRSYYWRGVCAIEAISK